MQITFRIMAVSLLISGLALAEEAKTFTPKPITMSSQPCGEDWREWEGIGNSKGMAPYRERLASICAGTAGDIWIGTSRGRLLSMVDGKWTLQANLGWLEITGIALDEADKVWLSTSDGIRELSRDKDVWNLTEHLHYYQGHPLFVSGGYIPGEDSVRSWGYVDGIYVPPKNRTYSPFVVSTEHGLFAFAKHYRVWHHFLSHYWGANSPWLDIRELIPHRRPTRVVEDSDANLWIGTEWDGIVRLNASARNYHSRDPKNNKKDGTEFSSIGPKEMGCDFDRVVDLVAGRERGIWAVLGLKDKQNTLARYDGSAWTTFTLPEKSGKATSICEVQPDLLLVGVASGYRAPFMLELDWKSQKIEPVLGPKGNVFKIVTLPDGRVFAATWFGLYERSPQKSVDK